MNKNKKVYNKIVGIYKLVSPIGEVYIGQSWDIKQRWAAHKSNVDYPKTKLSISIFKYGFENFLKEIIHELPKDLSDQSVMNNYEYLYLGLYKQAAVKILNTSEKISTKLNTPSQEKYIRVQIKNIFLKNMGINIKHKRLQAKITQRQLSKNTGIGRAICIKLENGIQVKSFSIEMLHSIANELNCTQKDFNKREIGTEPYTMQTLFTISKSIGCHTHDLVE